MGFGEEMPEAVAMGHGPALGSSFLPLDTRNRTRAPSDSAPAAPPAAATPICSRSATCTARTQRTPPCLPAAVLWAWNVFLRLWHPLKTTSYPPPQLPARQNQSIQPRAHAYCGSSHGMGTAAGPATAQGVPPGRALSWPVDVASRFCLHIPALVNASWLLGGLCVRRRCPIHCNGRPMVQRFREPRSENKQTEKSMFTRYSL